VTLYCGIDLYSNNHVVVVIDEEDRRIVQKRVANSLDRTLALLAPYREELAGIAVESTFYPRRRASAPRPASPAPSNHTAAGSGTGVAEATKCMPS
jgi:hypothetical protein